MMWLMHGYIFFRHACLVEHFDYTLYVWSKYVETLHERGIRPLTGFTEVV